MPVCRLIFRIDFKPNYDIIDAPGAIMKTLVERKKDFFSQVGHNTSGHAVVASYESADKSTTRHFTVEPKSIVLNVETQAGIPVRSIEHDEAVSQMFDLASNLAEEYEVDEVTRMGFRIFYFSKLGAQADSSFAAFRSLVGTPVVDGLERLLGEMDDYGIAVTGADKDKLGYRVHCGPFAAAKETSKYFEHLDTKRFAESTDYNFVCDLDLYDQNFSLARVPLVKWSRTLTAKQVGTIAKLEELAKAHLGEQHGHH